MLLVFSMELLHSEVCSNATMQLRLNQTSQEKNDDSEFSFFPIDILWENDNVGNKIHICIYI